MYGEQLKQGTEFTLSSSLEHSGVDQGSSRRLPPCSDVPWTISRKSGQLNSSIFRCVSSYPFGDLLTAFSAAQLAFVIEYFLPQYPEIRWNELKFSASYHDWLSAVLVLALKFLVPWNPLSKLLALVRFGISSQFYLFWIWWEQDPKSFLQH